ncbi:MAG: hypothetical protein Q9227_007767 [Pyrenula ochraceoflavens]
MERPRVLGIAGLELQKTQSLPTVSLLTASNITAFKTLPVSSLFIAHLSPIDADLIFAYKNFAEAHHHAHPFGITLDPALATSEGTSTPSIVCYNPLLNDASALPGHFDSSSLTSLYESCTAPAITRLTHRNLPEYLSLVKPIAYLFLPRQAPSASPTLNDMPLAALNQVAKSYRSYVSFVHVDAGEFAHMAPMLELEEGKWPAFVVHDHVRDQVYVYPQDEEVRRGGVEELVLGVLKQTLQPTIPRAKRVESERTGSQELDAGHDEL